MRRGFTLVEVLAAMAILMVLMLFMTRIFNEAAEAFTKGNNTVLRNSAARAAMDMITKDLEGMVVDRGLGYYKSANNLEGNYDGIAFITMSGPPVASDIERRTRAYQLVSWRVRKQRPKGKNYDTFRLVRGVVDFDSVRIPLYNNTDIMGANKDWWNQDVLIDNLDRFEVPVIDNLVRFDVWTVDTENVNAALLGDGTRFGGNDHFSSMEVDPTANLEIDDPPGYIDVYLQVTTDDAMKQAGPMTSSGQAQLIDRGYSLMYRESNVIFVRVVPIMAHAERIHPVPY